MKIAVDLDDTLSQVDRAQAAAAYIERNRLPFRMIDPDSAELKKIFDWTYEDATRFVLEGGGLSVFSEAKLREGAREALSSWRAAGHTVVILTGRFREWFSDPVRLSRDWLEARGVPFDEIVSGIPFAEKGNYCREHGIGILIDDNLEACLGAQKNGVAAVLAIGRHNRARANEIEYGGENWSRIDETVRKLWARTAPDKRA